MLAHQSSTHIIPTSSSTAFPLFLHQHSLLHLKVIVTHSNSTFLAHNAVIILFFIHSLARPHVRKTTIVENSWSTGRTTLSFLHHMLQSKGQFAGQDPWKPCQVTDRLSPSIVTLVLRTRTLTICITSILRSLKRNIHRTRSLPRHPLVLMTLKLPSAGIDSMAPQLTFNIRIGVT